MNLGAIATSVQLLLLAPLVAVATVLFWQCFDLLRAESHLSHAAAAAAREATLPRATRASVVASADRVLQGTGLHGAVDRPILWINGLPASADELHLLQSGDQVQVSLAAHAAEAVPDWLRPLGLSLAHRRLHATVSVSKP